MPYTRKHVLSQPAHSDVPTLLHDTARQTLQRLRSALTETIAAVESEWDPNTHHMTALGPRFGIDKKLAWKIGRIVRAEDPFEAAKNLPGRAGMEKYLAAAHSRGVPVVCIDRVRAAFSEYQNLVRTHAPDRASFETMVSGARDGAPDRTELEQRKAAFRANSYLFGVHAKLQLRADFIHRSATPGRMDMVSVRGFIDLVRTRVDVSWPLGRLYYMDDKAEIHSPLQREPIDPPVPGAASRDGRGTVPLLRSFCSQPLPEIYEAVSPQGAPEAMLEGGTVGRTGAVTCLTGEMSRAHAPIYRDDQNRFAGLAVRCFTPCEALLCDHFVHRDLFGRMEYKTLRVSEMYRHATGVETIDRMRLPMPERVVFLGTGLDVVGTPVYTRHRELAAHVFERTGWNPDEFYVYRLTVEHPVTPACIFMQHPLLDPPADSSPA